MTEPRTGTGNPAMSQGPGAPGLGESAPSLSGDTAVMEREQVSTDDGDHERFAHYVPKDKIVESAVMGTPVRALCGKKWVPSRDPSKFPVCPDCKRIYDGLPPGTPD